MSVFKSKSVYIIILTIEALINQAPLPYAMALILPLLPIQKPMRATILAIVGQLLSIGNGGWIQKGLPILTIIITIITHAYYHGLPCKQYFQPIPSAPLSSKYLIFIYLFLFSFLSLATNAIANTIALVMLFLMLLLYSIHSSTTQTLRYIVLVCNIVSMIWGVITFTTQFTDIDNIPLNFLKKLKSQLTEFKWYYLMLNFSVWLGFMLFYQINQEKRRNLQIHLGRDDFLNGKYRILHPQLRIMSAEYSPTDIIQVQMKDMSKPHYSQNNINFDTSSEKHFVNNSTERIKDITKLIKLQELSNQKKLPRISPQLINKVSQQQIQNKLKKSPQKKNLFQFKPIANNGMVNGQQIDNLQQNQQGIPHFNQHHHPNLANSQPNNWNEHEGGQGQITNLFLLIPFTLFSPTYLQIPIYFYLLWLQSGRTPMWVFVIMFFSICAITFLQHSASLEIKILLRLCLILIVNKNFKLAINITQVLRSIWLRSSFVFVLLVLFWFALLTVNLFHISFVIIVLLFIAKTSNTHSQQPSFRHKNWKYLVILFNIFLISRLFWLISQKDKKMQLPERLHNILSLFGIPYRYNLSLEYFNMIPLIVSGVLTVQYWTYSSRIYDLETKKAIQLLPTYRTLILKLIQFFTIVYYKLVPWTSHLVVIVIIVSLEFSLIADLVLIWSLFILLLHMIKPNEVSAYRTLYKMWNIFLRLVSIQIILRYIFQFIKFPIFFANVSQFPIIKSLIKYQQVLGLAIRQSSSSYLKNIFTKFQLMMILDFTIIAISFLTIQYYQIMIKYHQAQKNNQKKQSTSIKQQQHQLSQINIQPENLNSQQMKQKLIQGNQSNKVTESISNHDAIFIYENYIDFKLTKWLQNFNKYILMFSQLFLKIYYPLLATYSCFFYSFATFTYFLCSVHYYLKINTKYYVVDVVSEVQRRIMELFDRWRTNNNIKGNVQESKQQIKGQNIMNKGNRMASSYGAIPQVEMKQITKSKFGETKSKLKRKLRQPQSSQKSKNAQELQRVQNAQQQKLKNFPASAQQLKKQIKLNNPQIIFDNYINLHSHLRYWLLILTMIYIIINYTSRIFVLTEVRDFLNQHTIELWRFVLFMCGTSLQSHISIDIYLIIVALTVIQIKCCGFITKLGRPTDLEIDHPEAPQSSQQVSQEKSKKIQNNTTEVKRRTKSYPTLSNFLDPDPQAGCNQQQLGEKSLWQVEEKNNEKFTDMEISILLGINKIAQRFFVILLVFVSLLQNNNPFSIIYLICACLLNFMGSKSIQGLTWTLSFLVIVQYCLVLSDSTSKYVGAGELFPKLTTNSWIILLFGVTDPLWISYLTFGKNINEIFVLYLSMVILMLYQVCFNLEEYNWSRILMKMTMKIKIGFIQRKIYEHFSRVYEYALVYSPLCITTLCLGLYLMDFTATNMFLSILSIIFLFKSFLLQNYSNSHPFWKCYFRILQILIVVFMVVYCILSTPMYQQFCNKMLCSPQQFHTKVTKTILLLILQVGIDLIQSHHFINAMNTLQSTLNQTSSYYRLAISYMQNDKKIQKQFKSIQRKQQIKTSLEQIQKYINLYENDHTAPFDNQKQVTKESQSWFEALLELLPSLIDKQLIKTPQQTKKFVQDQNKEFIDWLEKKKGKELFQKEIRMANQLYINQLQQCKILIQQKRNKNHQSGSSLFNKNPSLVRKSFIHGIVGFDEGRKSIQRDRRTMVQHFSKANNQEKTKLLYLLIFESILSNWHYLTYLLMILEFLINMGVLTLPFPILTFSIGIVHSYQAPKILWRLAFLSLLPPIFFKYSLQIEIFKPSEVLQQILIGSNNTSIIIQYFLMFFIVIQCLILKVVGLYDKSTAQVQCMNIALIRNIINFDQNNSQQQRKALFTLLQRSKQPSQTFFEYFFSLYQCKSGYDYSTMMVTIQLSILFYIFTFYDKMAIKQQLTFYKMIEYNQFTTGMVVMAFIQLGFMLIDRILTVLELSYKKWDVTLILKYIVLVISLIYVHAMVLAFFPYNSGYFGSNKYITVFYILHIFYFLISALQVKVGVNKESRGFMDRYTWYNGYIYMSYRAIPFLFQFKIFSDWTFTTTSLRLFDWIKFQQILGYLYVAKCNSLFLRGKKLGSKIQWWKKLLMGFPLLLCIILLLFGPLILFSSLNPLASLNQITGGYLQLTLKVNKTNEYPFYINTHFTDMHFFDQQPDQELQQIITTYELDKKSIQIVHLQPYSDQYWEISQGSYDKLLDEPQTSLYELTMRVKFDRNQTKTTPVYELNTYAIPIAKVPSFKQTLQGNKSFIIGTFVPAFMRLDNNNGLHFLTEESLNIEFHAEQSKTLKKKYWVINNGITFKIASDKYSKAIFGYSVMSFYISIILVVANYFRFLFQGSAYTIIMSDIPYADPLLSICDGIHQSRLRKDVYQQQIWYWTLIDVIRSPDLMKALTGNYLNARIETLKLDEQSQNKENVKQVQSEKKLIKKLQKFQ